MKKLSSAATILTKQHTFLNATEGNVRSKRGRFRQGTVALASWGSVMLLFICTMVFSIRTSAEDGETEPEIQAAAAAKTQGAASEKKFEDFDPKNFTNSTNIDNVWLPLTPGTRFTFTGTSVEDGGKKVPHRFVMHVTDLTKVIGGVRSVVLWDLDYTEGELAEAELAFFAQDKEGNVWRMGEYPEEYDGAKFVAATPWLHGIEEARAGIEMKAKPQPGTPSYAQGWGPAVNWSDRGQVDQIGQKVTVPAGRYDDVLVIAETSGSEPNAQQLKFYARGVGNVRVGWRGAGEITQEVLELTKIEKLEGKALADVRAGALKLEKSAYARSKNVYGTTAPLEPQSGTSTK
jgi:hypothetical protein